MKIIRKAHVEVEEEIRLEFDLIEDRSACLSFDYDETAKQVILHNDAQRENYEYAISHPDKYHQGEVRTYTHKYKVPSVGKCDCGEEVQLVNEYMGACQCPSCERWYNLFGQPLNPPEMWEENY